MKRALVVDDEPAIRRALRRSLQVLQVEVEEAEDGVDGIGKLGRGPWDLVVTDLRMPRADGFAVLKAAREQIPRTPVVILTAHGTVTDCVAAMRGGAFDFLSKPYDAQQLRDVVERALESGGAGDGDDERAPAPRPALRGALIGDSPAMQEVIALCQRVADSDATVLLTGESGTGKEVVARLIHATSGRAGGPMVTVNCGAIPEGLIESELFGHAKGSFTGATDKRIGRFAQASGGTLFLDEIGELPLNMQVRLLRVLQEHEVQGVGETRPQRVDIRVIAATNRNLEAMVKDGKFREDLYYRLAVMPIPLLPLRERRGDVALLAAHFLGEAAGRTGRAIAFGDGVPAALAAYDWPGNVRELQNLVERLAILDTDGEIRVDDLPPKLRGAPALPAGLPALSVPDGGIDLPALLGEIERTLVDEALRKAGGNRTRAADLLGINRTTLVEKLKRLGR